MRDSMQNGGWDFSGALSLGAAVFLAACSNEAPGAWSALATCLAGDAVNASAAERAEQLHQIELSEVGAADPPAARWPARCSPHADRLYQSLSSSGTSAILYRTMHRQLGCTEAKGSCKFPTDTSVLALAPELWEGAKQAGLENKLAANVAAPKMSVKVLLTAADWRSFAPTAGQMVTPTPAADGRVVLLLKQGAGRVQPVGCEFAPGLERVECIQAHEAVPKFPAQSVELVPDDRALVVSGLTEEGRMAYDLRTGQSCPVRGLTGQTRRDGLAVERGAEDRGFVVVDLSQTPKPKELELATGEVVLAPVSLGTQLAWVEKDSSQKRELVVQGMKGRKLGAVSRYAGPFQGAFHLCKRSDRAAIAVWAPHAGQRDGKPTAGSDRTQIAVSVFKGAEQSPVGLATMPYDRAAESSLVCTERGATLAWAREADGAIEVGQIDCTPAGCKATEVKIPGIVSKWWWAVAPVADKVAVMWRDMLGATRLRVAPLAALVTTKDVLVFDAPDHGGPEVGEATVVETGDALLLLFKGDKPVALRVGPDGSARVL